MSPGAPAALRARIREAPLGRLLLGALSWAYGAGVFLRRLFYAAGLLRTRSLPARTVCIGNITAGGTGKTTAVMLAAHTLWRRRIKTAILSRGYGRVARDDGGVLVILDGHDVSWREAGDEPWMMHQALRGFEVPILVSPDRYRAGLEAVRHYDPKVILLDDGYQHWRLARDLDIVLVNAADPCGGGSLLPLGDLREPWSALRRAGLVVLTHCERLDRDAIERAHAAVRRANRAAPIVESEHRAAFLLDLKLQKRRRLSTLKGKPAAAFSAVGDPASFEDSLKALGAELRQAWRFPDHHPFTLAELRSIANASAGAPVVTTFKDVPRLPPGWESALAGEVLVLGVRLEITSGAELWEAALCG